MIKNFIKLSSKIVIIVMLFVVSSLNINAANNQTLGDIKKELAALEAEAKANETQRKLNESEVATLNKEIKDAEAEIEQVNIDYVKAQDEIVILEEEIKEKNEEIKTMAVTFQLSNNQNEFLEYVLKADSISDMVYRSVVVNQITEYNEQIIEESQNLKTERENALVELDKKEKSLIAAQEKYSSKIATLSSQNSELQEGYNSILEDIKIKKDVVNTYAKLCDNDNQKLSECGTQLVNSSFRRPMASGRVTSNFGWRYIFGSTSFHYGVDIAGASVGSNIYAVASGIVVSSAYSSCGGNIVWVVHKIDGAYYSSAYMHLNKISVKVGDVVTSDTVVGLFGPSNDSCTTGSHLHLSITKGARYVSGGMYGIPSNQTYYSASDYYKNSIDPKTVIKLPAIGGTFSGR